MPETMTTTATQPEIPQPAPSILLEEDASRAPVKLKPGYLVSLTVRLDGGVEYQREQLEDELLDNGERKERWETEKITADDAEFDAAKKVQSKIRSLVVSVCTRTHFGLVCAKEDLADLDAALAAGRTLRDEFNAESVHTKVRMASLRGEIAENQTEAIQSIRGEIGLLVEQMNGALQAGSVQDIRDAANEATKLGRLLDEESDASGALGRAIKAARATARAIVAQVEKKGVALADVLAEAELAPVAQARFAFLGEDEQDEGDEGQAEDGALDAMPVPAVIGDEDEDADGQDDGQAADAVGRVSGLLGDD